MAISIRPRVFSLIVGMAAAAGLVLGGSSPIAAAKIHPGNATLVMKSVAVTGGVPVGRTVTCPTGDVPSPAVRTGIART